jgi:hypothetical protein
MVMLSGTTQRLVEKTITKRTRALAAKTSEVANSLRVLQSVLAGSSSPGFGNTCRSFEGVFRYLHHLASKNDQAQLRELVAKEPVIRGIMGVLASEIDGKDHSVTVIPLNGGQR